MTVSATWAGPPVGALFELVLDTHSVDLDTLDLADAFLRNDRGEVMAARPWSAPPGGHHRSGSLSFEGDPIPFLASARWIELVLYDVGDAPERTLRWEIPQSYWFCSRGCRDEFLGELLSDGASDGRAPAGLGRAAPAFFPRRSGVG